MSYTVRSGTAADLAAIETFTHDTFSWGDYVDREYPKWIADPASNVLVAADDADQPIGLAVGTLLSPTELWLQAARVHPDWRRKGIATELFRHLCKAGQTQGAAVVRLGVDDWNEPAVAQVTGIGMRHTSDWVAAWRDVVARAPVTKGNGGRRRPPAERLDSATSAEANAAYVAWSSGELGRKGRSLLAVGWKWRRLLIDDLVRAAKGSALWMCPAGWVMAAVNQDTLEIGWLETGPDQAYELTKSAIDLAAELGARRIELKVPAIEWLVAALDSLGFEMSRYRLFEMAL